MNIDTYSSTTRPRAISETYKTYKGQQKLLKFLHLSGALSRDSEPFVHRDDRPFAHSQLIGNTPYILPDEFRPPPLTSLLQNLSPMPESRLHQTKISNAFSVTSLFLSLFSALPVRKLRWPGRSNPRCWSMPSTDRMAYLSRVQPQIISCSRSPSLRRSLAEQNRAQILMRPRDYTLNIDR
jgi:hypothetical protein